MTQRDLVNARAMARRLVDHGYVAAMNYSRIRQLAEQDPRFPPSLPNAGRERLWSWSMQVIPYFDSAADPDLVHAGAVAERVVRDGYAHTMTRYRVEWLADNDPRFGKPLTTGPSKKERLWSWALQVRPYFDPAAGPGLELDPAAEPALVNWRQMARRLVEGGYVQTMTPQRLYRLAARDAHFPRSVPSAGKERLWWWQWQLLPYFDPDAEPDLVNARAVAERVVRNGYAKTMSRQRIRELAHLDPLFPAPLPSTGDEQLWSWSLQLNSYFGLVHDSRSVSWRFHTRPPSRRQQRRATRAPRSGDPNRLPHVRVETLTVRESEVLQLVATGESNTDVGHTLGIAPRTVEEYLRRIFAKLSVTTRAEAAAMWLEGNGASIITTNAAP
jgi:DNA-binding CsgD family transcriptional regulator